MTVKLPIKIYLHHLNITVYKVYLSILSVLLGYPTTREVINRMYQTKVTTHNTHVERGELTIKTTCQ